MTPERLLSEVYDPPMDDARYTTCVVCNQEMEPMKMGPAICWANDRTSDGDYNLWLVFAHPECIERVAHPDFDLDRQRGRLDEG
jgi:hypothetical protein